MILYMSGIEHLKEFGRISRLRFDSTWHHLKKSESESGSAFFSLSLSHTLFIRKSEHSHANTGAPFHLAPDRIDHLTPKLII